MQTLMEQPVDRAIRGKRFVALRAEPVRAALSPSYTYNPLAAPTFDGTGTQITVDVALQNPSTVITPLVIDITAQKFFVDRVFTNGGGVTGGAVIYNEVAGGDYYAERDVQEIAPGQEYPVITFQRRGRNVALVHKYGGKYAVTWEARDRNNVTEFTNAARQLGNTLVRKINQFGVAILDAYVTANSRSITGKNWSTVVTVGSSASNHTLWPTNDFANLAKVAAQEEMGVNYGLLIMNPQEYANLTSIYGSVAGLNEILAAFGLDIFVTNRVTAGTMYAVAPGMLGEMRIEDPLRTRTWDDSDGIDQTWIQTGVRFLMFANNPFAVLKVTGLAG